MTSEDKQKNNYINIILRHTNYSSDEALIKLNEFDNNYMEIIKEYYKMKSNIKKEEKKLSLNQSIFKEIRDFLETSNS